jgi:starch phosphorylase
VVEGPDGGLSWHPAEQVEASAVDTPVVGWRGARVNTLRLWTASSLDPLKLDAFNAGDHAGALADQVKADSLVRVLYPADSSAAGQELRLRQEYFFSSASIQDIIRRHVQYFGDVRTLPDKAAIQLNDTHPSVAVAEVMRLLIDVYGLEFDEAWEVTKATIGYTNHTLLPEALESWPLPLFERLLPRHMQIIYAINSRVLREARRAGLSGEQIAAISLIDEGGERRVRMANLAFVGAHSVNGVAALHTDLMKTTVFSDLHALYPARINNKTNGVTPRRWLLQCNPGLTKVIREGIGDAFLDDAEKLSDLNALADDAQFGERIAEVKRANKVALAAHLKQLMGVRLDPDALFDVQIKRIHEYKRQLLNLVETVALYDQIRSHPERDWVPRVKIFGGKAASSYHNAKLIIKLTNDIARRVNSDPSVGGLLKVVFVPNYNVSFAERIIPAADLSEQISTAGMEASGTGNMKFALNGALTIGTLDGANVEIKDRVGDENIVIFGLTADEVNHQRANGYNPRAIIEGNRELRQAINAIASGVFSPDDRDRYKGLMGGLYDSDWFMLAADFDAYTGAQREVDARWNDVKGWRKSAIHNIANVGWFSSDRTIGEYARDIWGVK